MEIDMAGAGLETYMANMVYSFEELHIYGSSRLGIHKPDTQFCSFEIEHYFNPYDSTWKPVTYSAHCEPEGSSQSYEEYSRLRGERFYELSNHLGNVLSTITDRKLPVGDTSGGIDTVLYFVVDIASANDYYPFGMLMPERSYNLSGYRFGFQGQEADNELKGDGNSMNFKYRMHDPRLGRFFAVDPLSSKYAYNSPYAFSENRVTDAIELEGLEKLDVDEISQSVFHSIFSKGNTTKYMSTLPTKSSPGEFLKRKHERWAKKASRGSEKHKNKLVKKGITYFEVNIEFNYTLRYGSDLKSALSWMNLDIPGRGVVLLTFSQNELDNSYANIANIDEVIGLNNMVKNGFKNSRAGAGINESIFDSKLNLIFLNPHHYGSSGPFSFTLSATEVVVHESGHNSAALNYHDNPYSSYQYNQKGLQSMEPGLYPSLDNIETIINDESNRQTIK